MTKIDNDWKREKTEISAMLSGSVKPLEFDVSLTIDLHTLVCETNNLLNLLDANV